MLTQAAAREYQYKSDIMTKLPFPLLFFPFPPFPPLLLLLCVPVDEDEVL